MALSDDFEAAQLRVKQLSRTPNNDELLELYALYKQATAGDATGKRPGMLDLKGRAKFDAWAARRGTDRDAAISGYVALVEKLAARYG
jgi:diazepam-binding inhibitor (GABA receptor modulator, acyl-CoA-binding protein)